MNINISMNMEIEDGSYEKLKAIEHHADHLLSLDEWPEIKRVYAVHVQKESPACDAEERKDLLNKIIELYQVGHSVRETIRWCFFVGFDKKDLINDYGFSEKDVIDAEEDSFTDDF